MGQSPESSDTAITSESSPAADAVLMIRPAGFGRNEVTRPTNPYQDGTSAIDPEQVAEQARQEFDVYVSILKRTGVEVHVFEGRTTTALPDEVFPNNWISTHPDGTAILYPMMAWNRRQERRRDILETLQQQSFGFKIDRLIDLSHLEEDNQFLEGTGSLVFDHESRLAYACISPRTHLDALREFGRATDFGIITFNAHDSYGRAIYHTNVMMSIGEKFAFVCLDAIQAADERLRLITRLERAGREVIELRLPQLKSFCGNIMQLRCGDKRLIVMSRRARAALDDLQVESLQRHGDLVMFDLTTIEKIGGGSARCMLAELLLPRKSRLVGTAPTD